MKILFFSLPFDKIILRFYLMMAVVVAAFFAGVPWLGLVAVPIFMSILMGIRVTKTTSQKRFTIKSSQRTTQRGQEIGQQSLSW